ncbi:CHAT domain-containing tetratricopeptide repeat protein [Sphingobium lignivorans]|uniref:CHAT domain-containing protein n=1 Tax=Sphingobium lignivorans TaxID=2735886 RepID=A0ABR6NAE6_9SPHN|nr:CHAT domain-containing tetratricopeptide repeat protein [Sphingobium lignivorans]MBB5984250.1 CHAT domain-containing protein [Sphingobium lignivorans]
MKTYLAGWGAVLAPLLLIGSVMPVVAKAPVDRSRLDDLIARSDAADPDSDPEAYRALGAAALAEAKRLYPAGHPEVAARELSVAQSMAARGEMADALAMLERIIPVLAGAVSDSAYRASWRNALGTRGYILNFQGDHAGALVITEQVVADFAADPAAGLSKDRATALSNLAASYLEHGRLEDALARNAEAIDIALKLPQVPVDVGIWYGNRVVYLYTAGRTEDAITTAQTAIARLGPAIGPEHAMMANLHANLGAIMLRVNRPRDAMPMIRRAYELLEKAAGAPTQTSATMRVQFAQALVRAGQFEDAVAFLEVATPIIDVQLGNQSDRALNARDTLLVALIGVGDGAQAQALAQQLVAVRDERLPAGHRDRANARDNLTKAAFANADWPTAARAAEEAVSLRAAMLPASHPDLLLARAMMLRVQDRANTRDVAALLAEARSLFEALVLNANLLRGSAQAERQRPAYGWLAELFARRGAVEEAFQAQQWAARTALDDVLAIAALERATATGPDLAALIGERRQLLAARQGLEAQLDANLGKPDATFDLAGLSTALEANLAEIARLDASLDAEERARLFFRPSTLAEVRAASDPRTLTLMITALDQRHLVTAIDGRRVRQYEIDAAAPIDALVARLRSALDMGEASPFDRDAAAHLHALLFPRDIAAMMRPARRLAIIANGALGALPLGLLVPDIRSRDYLADRHVISRLVRAPRTSQSTQEAAISGAALIALGGVEGRQAGARMAMRSAGTAQAINALADLPEARRELAALAQALGAQAPQIFTGAAATKARLRALDVPPDAILAFATHGLVAGDLDGLAEPALLLTPEGEDDGLLKPSEIGRLDLPAALVILSACNTAGAASGDRPQLSGLVQGFFLAGARRVMASHWLVRDDMARRLSVGTVRAIREGMDPATALGRAIRTVRTGKDGEAAVDHPALWAPFELFSG